MNIKTQPPPSAMPPAASPAGEKPGPRRPLKLRWYFIGAAGMFLLLVVLVYVSAFWHEPDPSTDYLAMVNAKAAAVPEEDRAWPLYREILIKYDVMNMDPLPGYGPVRNPDYKPPATQPADATKQSSAAPAPASVTSEENLSEAEQSLDEIWGSEDDSNKEFYTWHWRIPTDDSRWPQTEAALASHAQMFEEIRQATRKKGMGLQITLNNIEERTIPGYNISHQYQNHPLWGDALIHQFNTWPIFSQKLHQLLSVDLHLAAYQKDYDRALDNLQAMHDLASHTRELTTDAAVMIANGSWDACQHDAALTLEKCGHGLSDEQLVRLEAILVSGLNQRDDSLDATRWEMEDFLQRIYGRNGRVTYRGLGHPMLKGLPHYHVLGVEPKDDMRPLLELILPWVVITTASHQKALAEMEGRFDTIAQFARLPLQEQLAKPNPLHTRLLEIQDEPTLAMAYWPVSQVSTYEIDLVIQATIHKAYHQAILVAIALERYRRQHGSYPAKLDELVPDYLSTTPQDPLASQPLLYKLDQSKPVLYSRGRDGDDDLAVLDVFPESGHIQDGDWVLYPVKE